VSPFAIHRLTTEGKSLVFLGRYGEFKAGVEGPISGNVLLRQAQYQAASDAVKALSIARNMVAGKIQNSRLVLMRAAREATISAEGDVLRQSADKLADLLRALEKTEAIESVRGIEGMASKTYFESFNMILRTEREAFAFKERSRRPPRDRINALISFLYTLLVHDCRSAAESTGLDPQVGYLHCLRPGRPALALDLMEELRPIIADRLAFSLINRKQIQADDFEERPGGAVSMSEKARKTLLGAYQARKQEEITHPTLNQKMPLGLVPQIQARLLARHLRGDLESYPPYIPR
jgi:CRISPR-associated protein Cas1